MADEYIKRKLAKAEFTGNFRDEYPTALIHALIDSVPSADVAPVRHGRWIFKVDSSWCGGGKYECSACKSGYAIGAYHEPDEFTYCPHCGAYMTEGRET